MSKVTGIYIGRFQPFHLGHLSAVKQALNEVDFLVIGIGSAQYKNTAANPFSDTERQTYIKKALDEANIQNDQYLIVPIPDIHNNPEWPAHVGSLTPDFERVFVGNDGIVKELFEKHTDIPIQKVLREIPISASDIRQQMTEGSKWEKSVPNAVATYLKDIEGQKRVKNAPQ